MGPLNRGKKKINKEGEEKGIYNEEKDQEAKPLASGP